MPPKFQPVRGTKDLIFEEAEKFTHIVKTAQEIAYSYGYKDIYTPIFEFTEVFTRTLGETSDVVHKEMYSFTDRGGDSITLRPEFTAGIARAFISNGLQQNLPIKLFSYGPLFRYERPQKGRQRQFHQVNYEWYGEYSPMADAETIIMGYELLSAIGIKDKVTLHINNLGDRETRESYRNALVKYLSAFKEKLSQDSQNRLETNPLRILDSKSDEDKEILKNAPQMTEYYSPGTKSYHDEVLDLIPYDKVINPGLVRGLDYYTSTVFEFIADSAEIGSQNTVIAGGRYDNLVKQMGGSDVSAIGFGAGIERLMLLLSLSKNTSKTISIISIDSSLNIKALEIATNLRQRGKHVEVITEKQLGKTLKKAAKYNSKYVVILAPKEYQEKKVIIKNLDNSSQETVALEDIAKYEF